MSTKIALIGMPGCGKTSIGRALAQRLNTTHIDLDDLIYSLAGASPATLITQQGEPAFRFCEREALCIALKQDEFVLSTGGGTILLEENRRDLKRVVRSFFIARPLELLSLEGRPLSLNLETLKNMYVTREPLYLELAEATIQNHDTIQRAAERIHQNIFSI